MLDLHPVNSDRHVQQCGCCAHHPAATRPGAGQHDAGEELQRPVDAAQLRLRTMKVGVSVLLRLATVQLVAVMREEEPQPRCATTRPHVRDYLLGQRQPTIDLVA